MAKTSKAFREKMRKRKASTSRQGTVIDKREWNKGRIRILPCHGEDPAKEFKSYYDKEAKKSVTSPATWGVVDPLGDYLDTLYRTGEKDQKDHASASVSRSTEYWLSCIVRGDEGTADNPNVRVFRATQGVYQYICDVLSDEDYGEDITDENEGRDLLIKKDGEGVNTKWKADKMDQEVIVEDEDLFERLVEISHTFDPSSHFFRFDLEEYQQLYEGVTGEELPEDCLEALEELQEGGTSVFKSSEDDDEDEYEYEEDEEEYEDDESDEEEEEEEYDEEDEEEDELLEDPPEGIEFGKTVVSFEGEDGPTQGVVQSWALDEEADEEQYLLAILEEDGDPDAPYLVDEDEVEIVESEDDESDEEEEEAEEAEPAVTRGKKSKKSLPRRPKGGAAKEIRSGKSKKKTTKKTSKKTTKKAKAKAKPKVTKKKTSKKTTKKKKKKSR